MRGFYNYDTRAPFVIPCACGSRDAYWHGSPHAARTYCCDPCWDKMQEEQLQQQSQITPVDKRK